MSRIGNTPIPLPEGVSIEQFNHSITVKGPKGELTRSLPARISLELEGKVLHVRRPTDEQQDRALHGLTRSLVANMVEGVSKGFQKVLELYGTGYRAQLQGKKLSLQIGFSHPVEMNPPEGVQFAILETFVPTSENNYLSCRIAISGIDNEAIGQTAATMRAYKKPEPYKGKGIRYLGEKVRRKAGKAAKVQK